MASKTGKISFEILAGAGTPSPDAGEVLSFEISCTRADISFETAPRCGPLDARWLRLRHMTAAFIFVM
jgi:hypothetical protein